MRVTFHFIVAFFCCTAIYGQSPFSNVAIKFPDDKILINCTYNGSGQPILHNPNNLNFIITYSDVIFNIVPDACFKIERTWIIYNADFYDPLQACTTIPNPNPNPIVNNPANLPGPTISNAGTAAPWTSTIVKISPLDPSPTDYSIFWDNNTNCYQYKQTIKIIDTQKPIIQICPATTLVLNDSTQNNPELWNAPYWPNPFANGNDLDESAVDLAIHAADSCGWPEVRYLLFLDLNADGIMETVINSVAPPPAGYVYFGNAQNPNFAGGELRKFDQRPGLDSTGYYRFGLFVSHDDLNTSASMQWNTGQNPVLNKAPELPTGNHKIKWIAADGCGNETICEYGFNITNQTTATRLPGETYGFHLFQISPNPFSEETSVQFQLPEPATVSLELRDPTGRLLFTKTADFPAGIQNITLRSGAELFSANAKGLLFCTLRTERYVALKTLLRL